MGLHLFVIPEILLCDISGIKTKAPCEASAMHGRHVCKGIAASVFAHFCPKMRSKNVLFSRSAFCCRGVYSLKLKEFFVEMSYSCHFIGRYDRKGSQSGLKRSPHVHCGLLFREIYIFDPMKLQKRCSLCRILRRTVGSCCCRVHLCATAAAVGAQPRVYLSIYSSLPAPTETYLIGQPTTFSIIST